MWRGPNIALLVLACHPLASCCQNDLLPLLTSNLEIDREWFRPKQPRRVVVPDIILHRLTSSLVDGRKNVKRPQQSCRQNEKRIFRQIVTSAHASAGTKGPMISKFDVVGVNALSRREVVDWSVVVSIRVESFRIWEEFGIEMQSPKNGNNMSAFAAVMLRSMWWVEHLPVIDDHRGPLGNKIVLVNDVALAQGQNFIVLKQ